MDLKKLQTLVVDALEDVKGQDIALFDTFAGRRSALSRVDAMADDPSLGKFAAMNLVEGMKKAGFIALVIDLVAVVNTGLQVVQVNGALAALAALVAAYGTSRLLTAAHLRRRRVHPECSQPQRRANASYVTPGGGAPR